MRDRAGDMIRYIETLRIPEGMHTGRPFVLRGWQKNIIRDVYGPVDSNGKLLCRTAVYSVSKKNGKTPIIAAICLGHVHGPEAKRNEQIYSAAYDRDQAKITFEYMRQMIEMDEELSSELVIRTATKEIFCPATGSRYKALSSEVKGKHGLGPAVLIFDELAQFGVDRIFYDTLMQGRGAHEEPLAWIISTQSPDDKAVLSELIDYGLLVNSGEIHDPTFRLFLWTAPMDADPHDEETWKLCNPALGDFLNLDDMHEASRTAQNMPSAEATFRNLRLNQRIDASQHFISPSIWTACGGEVDLSAFDDRECTGGLDLSGKNDLTALVFQAENDDGVHHVLPYFWTPGDGLRERERRDRAPYCLWRDQGFLEAKPGKVIDYGWIARKIGKLNGILKIAWIRFDRWRVEDLQRELIDAGVDCWIENIDWKPGDTAAMPDGLRLIPHGQGFKDMNPAVEIVEDVLTDQRLRHGGHPVLTYCASNTRVQKDPAGNRKFDKLKSTGRIDGMVALAMALVKSEIAKDEPSIYETRGLETTGNERVGG